MLMAVVVSFECVEALKGVHHIINSTSAETCPKINIYNVLIYM